MATEEVWQSWTGEDGERPASWGRTMVISLCAIAIGVGVTRWLDSSSSQTFIATLESHTTLVQAPRAGRIQKILLETGATVQPGDSVLLLEDEMLSHKIAAKHQQVASINTELSQRRASADVDLAWRLKDLNTEILSTRLKIAGYLKVQFNQQLEQHAFHKVPAVNTQVAAFQPSAEIITPLVREDAFSNAESIRKLLEHEAIQNAAEVSQVQIELCEERLGEIKELKARLTKEIQRAHGVDNSANRLAIAQQELSQLKQQPMVEPLKATAYGRIGHFLKQGGDAVVTGESLGEILDDDRRFLTLKLPCEKLSLFGAETELKLMFPDGLSRKGKIARETIEAAMAHVRRSEDDSSAFVRLRIVPTDKLWPEIADGAAVVVKLDD